MNNTTIVIANVKGVNTKRQFKLYTTESVCIEADLVIFIHVLGMLFSGMFIFYVQSFELRHNGQLLFPSFVMLYQQSLHTL